ncbi:MAG: NADH-quinone oxidoreductase subunit NuoE [Pseudomonadota bacterium]
MAVRRLAHDQPEKFQFTPENLAWARDKIEDYPDGRQASAVIPILWRAQEQHDGWLPEPAIRLVADMLGMPYIRVLEIATFYTMFQLNPVGKVAHINVCGTTPCMLRGAEDIVAVCRSRIAPHPFELSEDGKFSWEEVECAGACVNAPMVQIGNETFEDLTPDSFETLLDALGRGEKPTPGPQSARKASEPISGLTSLTGGHNGASAHAGNGESGPDPAGGEGRDGTTPSAATSEERH